MLLDILPALIAEAWIRLRVVRKANGVARVPRPSLIC